MSNEIKTGTYTGTGAALSVVTGFKPKFLMLVNITDGTVVSLQTDTMADGKNISIDTEVALEASQGVTLTPTGFTLGTGATVNANEKVFHYVAIGNSALDAAGA